MAEQAAEPGTSGRHYALVCSSCGRRRTDDGLVLDCPADHPPALLRTEYAERQFSPFPGQDGIFRYRRWLPVTRTLDGAGRTVTYRSNGLGSALGLPNLWIAFNGYWPERGAFLETGTFKELEAYTVLGRLRGQQMVLAVASSGNTGAAFAWACSREQVPCLLIIPGNGLRRLSFRGPLSSCVNLVVIEDGDYPDAIELAAAASRMHPFRAEGGVKNVGRRDGLATVLLSAFEAMGRLPTHYFQAVGSGTGAIAVLEAARRLRAATCGAVLPRLMLCQNRPFTPIHDAWRMHLRTLSGESPQRFRDAIPRVYADELTNWTPPYEIAGGIYDSLRESQGDVLVTGNAAARAAASMFLELEGVDIEPAAAVALACLRDAVARKALQKDAVVLLNITGGGRLRAGREYPMVPARPRLVLARGSLLDADETRDRIAALAPAGLPAL